MENSQIIGRITILNELGNFINDAKILSNDMHRNHDIPFFFESGVTSSHPITKTYQEAESACEVIKKAAKVYFGSDFNTFQRSIIDKWGIFPN